MAQPAVAIAQEVTFMYTKTSGDTTLNPYFQSLNVSVRSAIMRDFPPGSKVFVRREMRLRVAENVVLIRVINIAPPEATTMGPSTKVAVNFVADLDRQDTSRFFSDEIWYPNPDLRRMYDNLVGLDEIKSDLMRKMVLLLEPAYIDHWLKEHLSSSDVPPLVTALKERYPMIVLEGEVGAGKTALARSVGDQLAETLQTKVAMLVMNAQVRGSGLVGEISKNLVNAFEAAEALQDRERIPVLLLIDEADTLAQTRGGRQMHHDDNAGVNTLIQRIDRLRGRYILLLFATNLYQSLDSAVLRRAMAVYRFDRPNEQRRADVFRRYLGQFGFSQRDIALLVDRTAARPVTSTDDVRRPKVHRYTYSDITQRILPTAIEDAVYANAPLTLDFVVRACDRTLPTPESTPFE